LISNDFQPKVSNLGCSREFSATNQSTTSSDQDSSMLGGVGGQTDTKRMKYFAPESLVSKTFSEKSDGIKYFFFYIVH